MRRSLEKFSQLEKIKVVTKRTMVLIRGCAALFKKKIIQVSILGVRRLKFQNREGMSFSQIFLNQRSGRFFSGGTAHHSPDLERIGSRRLCSHTSRFSTSQRKYCCLNDQNFILKYFWIIDSPFHWPLFLLHVSEF